MVGLQGSTPPHVLLHPCLDATVQRHLPQRPLFLSAQSQSEEQGSPQQPEGHGGQQSENLPLKRMAPWRILRALVIRRSSSPAQVVGGHSALGQRQGRRYKFLAVAVCSSRANKTKKKHCGLILRRINKGRRDMKSHGMFSFKRIYFSGDIFFLSKHPSSLGYTKVMNDIHISQLI